VSEGLPFEPARYTFDEPVPVVLYTLTGAAVVVLVHAVDVEDDRIELHVSTAVDVWGRALDEGAFHSDLEPEEFRPAAGAPVEVVLVLRAPMVARFASVESLLEELTGDGPSPLHQTEAWLLASAVQEVEVPGEPDATVAVGLRTGWARPFT
jgi:hypothetical protein